MNRQFIILTLSVVFSLLSACDDQKKNADQLGGGPGSSDQNSVNTDSGQGFCSPSNPDALGNPTVITSGGAKIDSDADPNAKGHDADWQPGTSGSVNGGYVDASKYAFVVVSASQEALGAHIGDWATVTNTQTGQSTYARIEDRGPAGGTNEISEAAATSVGIQYTSNRFTVGNPQVKVSMFAGTSGIQGNCQTVAQQ